MSIFLGELELHSEYSILTLNKENLEILELSKFNYSSLTINV